MGTTLWARVEVRGNVAPAIRKAGLWAWQVFEALVRIAKEENDNGFVADDRASGFEIGFWSNLPHLEDDLEEARDRLVEKGALHRVEGGYQFPKWHKYQAPSAERTRRWRERKRASQDVTDGHSDAGDVTPVTERHDRHKRHGDGTTPHHTVQDPPNPPLQGGSPASLSLGLEKTEPTPRPSRLRRDAERVFDAWVRVHRGGELPPRMDREAWVSQAEKALRKGKLDPDEVILNTEWSWACRTTDHQAKCCCVANPAPLWRYRDGKHLEKLAKARAWQAAQGNGSRPRRPHRLLWNDSTQTQETQWANDDGTFDDPRPGWIVT